MEIKRSFSDLEWLAAPKPVRDYVEHLERVISEHSGLFSKLEKRINDLESKIKRNSQNSNQPTNLQGQRFRQTKKRGRSQKEK